MAFSRAALKPYSRRPGPSGIRMWHYATADAEGTVDDSGYFNGAANVLSKYDIIFVVCDTGGSPTYHALMVTSASRAATVTTVPVTDPA